MDQAGLTPATLGFPPFLPRAPWWGGDLQTLRNFLVRRRASLAPYPELRLVLPLQDGSGDQLAAALNLPEPQALAKPLAVLVHGLTGSEDSAYMRRSAAHLLGRGFPVLRLNLRGAGPSRPLCRLRYHAGSSEDFAQALAALPPALARAGIIAVGFSLGANMLLKYLGERGAKAPLIAAVAVSAPLDLSASAQRIMLRRNTLYHAYLLGNLKREALALGLDDAARAAIAAARSIWEFDERFVAPANGFAGAEDYYARNSSGRFLDGIGVPTLVIYAQDDPWIPSKPYLERDWRRNARLLPLLPERGGHVGFQGRNGHGVSWHDLCVGRFLESALSRS